METLIYGEYRDKIKTRKGAHILADEKDTVLYLKHESTLLRRYNASGIEKKVVDWARSHAASTLVFENTRTKEIHRVSLDDLRKGTLDNVGNWGWCYYLPFESWEPLKELPFEVAWTKTKERI